MFVCKIVPFLLLLRNTIFNFVLLLIQTLRSSAPWKKASFLRSNKQAVSVSLPGTFVRVLVVMCSLLSRWDRLQASLVTC